MYNVGVRGVGNKHCLFDSCMQEANLLLIQETHVQGSTETYDMQ